MKLDLLINDREAKAPKTPLEAISRCPRCGSKELIPIDTDLLCGRCTWDSCQFSVDAGLMDNLFSKAFPQVDHGGDEYFELPAPTKNEPVKSA